MILACVIADPDGRCWAGKQQSDNRAYWKQVDAFDRTVLLDRGNDTSGSIDCPRLPNIQCFSPNDEEPTHFCRESLAAARFIQSTHSLTEVEPDEYRQPCDSTDHSRHSTCFTSIGSHARSRVGFDLLGVVSKDCLSVSNIHRLGSGWVTHVDVGRQRTSN